MVVYIMDSLGFLASFEGFEQRMEKQIPGRNTDAKINPSTLGLEIKSLNPKPLKPQNSEALNPNLGCSS